MQFLITHESHSNGNVTELRSQSLILPNPPILAHPLSSLALQYPKRISQ
jgi:hypothetical protein